MHHSILCHEPTQDTVRKCLQIDLLANLKDWAECKVPLVNGKGVPGQKQRALAADTTDVREASVLHPQRSLKFSRVICKPQLPMPQRGAPSSSAWLRVPAPA